MHSVIKESLQELSHFPGREEGLRAIQRYSLYPTAFYRSSDFSHSKRVAWLLASLEPTITKVYRREFDMDQALTMALVHDDAELVIGDYQAGNKSKMTKEQLAVLDEEERRAIVQMAARFPTQVHGHVYEDMLLDVLNYGSVEAQVVKFVDRFDALGEALHELYAGNVVFNTDITNEFGLIPLPFASYYKKLPQMLLQHQGLTPLTNMHPIFELPVQKDWDAVVSSGKPHTRHSFETPVGHPQYDAWKQVTLDAEDEEEIDNLITQKEFPAPLI